MRLVAAVLVAGALSLAACGAVPAAGSPLTPVQLKYRLLEQVGAIDYCDRDQYPLAREVTPDYVCLLYTSPSPRDLSTSRMPSSA